jgi:hypothetical protein
MMALTLGTPLEVMAIGFVVQRQALMLQWDLRGIATTAVATIIAVSSYLSLRFIVE